MGGPVGPFPVDEAIQQLFRSTVLKTCHEPLTREELLVAVANIQAKSSSGPDKLPTDLYKLLLYHHDFPSLVLSYFNDMLYDSTVPLEWLLSKLVTIPKKGKSVSLENLHPISIIAPPMRIFMKFVCGRIISYLPHAAHHFGFTSPALKDSSHMRPQSRPACPQINNV
ncbi:hypothetical protein RvY_09714 [Ramazzottius varieornatus]|uniref:Reverse transcriptase domain-containing protein n=1 Tax=Ramazzottius varieornatus TaxID=947166 RepID=A0A1D1VFP7_RAMVA|nr:hypothetical protein RvY_09714 [Ramazzottius varieornatus]